MVQCLARLLPTWFTVEGKLGTSAEIQRNQKKMLSCDMERVLVPLQLGQVYVMGNFVSALQPDQMLSTLNLLAL